MVGSLGSNGLNAILVQDQLVEGIVHPIRVRLGKIGQIQDAPWVVGRPAELFVVFDGYQGRPRLVVTGDG